MGLFSNSKSWGNGGTKGWQSAKDAKKAADRKNGVNQTEYARRKAEAKKTGKK